MEVSSEIEQRECYQIRWHIEKVHKHYHHHPLYYIKKTKSTEAAIETNLTNKLRAKFFCRLVS